MSESLDSAELGSDPARSSRIGRGLMIIAFCAAAATPLAVESFRLAILESLLISTRSEAFSDLLLDESDPGKLRLLTIYEQGDAELRDAISGAVLSDCDEVDPRRLHLAIRDHVLMTENPERFDALLFKLSFMDFAEQWKSEERLAFWPRAVRRSVQVPDLHRRRAESLVGLFSQSDRDPRMLTVIAELPATKAADLVAALWRLTPERELIRGPLTAALKTWRPEVREAVLDAVPWLDPVRAAAARKALEAKKAKQDKPAKGSKSGD